ncbi:MAG: hypothetical protein MRY21_05510 [Simkaniaceae bacterium]|nr:hypothetical protein [Simkaniaceae bacterium]
MKKIILLTLLCSFGFADLPWADALQELKDGNKRFMEGKMKYPNMTPSRRKSLETYQKPIAAIIACADSRVAPEIIFDQGIGDLFVIRVAGNVVCMPGMESILFAVFGLDVPLVIVCGHQDCGAIDSVIQNKAQEMPKIASAIEPAVVWAKRRRGNTLEMATKKNAQNQATLLKENYRINKQSMMKKLTVLPAYYDFSTGEVEFED